MFEPENIETNFKINKDKWINDGQYKVLSNFDSEDYKKIVTVFLKNNNYENLMEQFKSYYSVYQYTNNESLLYKGHELTKNHFEAKDNLIN